MTDPVSLTREATGRYTYCRRGLTTPFFPNTFFREQGGAQGWIPFSRGTLTNGWSDFVIWDHRTVAGSGLDLLVDLGQDCWLDSVSVHHVTWSGYGCALGNLTLLVKPQGESRLRFLCAVKPANDGLPLTNPWITLAHLNTPARTLCLRLEPAGRPTYESSSIGLIGLEVRGQPVAQTSISGDRPRPYPQPGRLAWLPGALPITPQTPIPVREGNRLAVEWLRDGIQGRLGQPLDTQSGPGPEIRLIMSPEASPESYELQVSPAGIEIRGDAAGLFYGAVTLLQLLQDDNGQLIAPAVCIQDGPRFPIRGIHLFLPARENIPFFKRLLDLMAGLKLNTVVLEVSGAMRYHAHPEINEAWVAFAAEMQSFLDQGIAPLTGDPLHLRRKHDGTHMNLAGGGVLEQEEVGDIVEYARRRHITVIPEVQTLSHCYYITLAHPELSERTDTPYPDTYCPSNPEVYPLVFDLLDEVIQVFQPPALCIGHDEAWAVGSCPRCREQPAAELIARDVNRLATHLAEQGVVPWMWADALDPDFAGWSWINREQGCFSQPPDTTGLIDRMPRDLVALNWNWGHTWSHGERPAVLERVIHQHGLSQLFANFEGAFFPDFDQRAEASEVQGAIMPSWVDAEHLALGSNGVIHNVVYSSEVLWSGCGPDKPDRLDCQIRLTPEIRLRLGGLNTLLPDAECAMLPLPIGRFVNAPLADPVGSLGHYDLRSAPTGHVTVHSTPFFITDPASNGGQALIVVQGRDVREPLYPDRVVGILIDQRASGLFFLHAASDSADAVLDWARRDNPVMMGLPRLARQLLGCYRIHYADGSLEEVELRYDVHLSRWNTRYGERSVMPYLADPVWRGQTHRGEAVTLWRLGWQNPKPSQTIASLDLVADQATDSAILLLAITLQGIPEKEGTDVSE